MQIIERSDSPLTHKPPSCKILWRIEPQVSKRLKASCGSSCGTQLKKREAKTNSQDKRKSSRGEKASDSTAAAVLQLAQRRLQFLKDATATCCSLAGAARGKRDTAELESNWFRGGARRRVGRYSPLAAPAAAAAAAVLFIYSVRV